MLFAPVHGGGYIISSVGIEYSCGMSVMWCILSTLLKVVKSQCDLSVLAVSLMGFQKKKLDNNNNNMYFFYSAIPTGSLLMALYKLKN